MPKDRVTGSHQGYGFVEFRGEEDADYVSTPTAPCAAACSATQLPQPSRLIRCCPLALLPFRLAQSIKILNMIKLFSKPIRVNKSAQDKGQADVGANLFIGNLDPEVDEKVSGASSFQGGS